MRLVIDPLHPEPRKVRTVLEVLDDGGVVVCPTDTVYAFVCLPRHVRAIARIAQLKGVRPQRAELSLICADLAQVARYTKPIATSTFRLLKRALPGPYTFVLPASAEVPKLFSNNRRTVGIRIPAHAVVQAIVRASPLPLVAASVHDPDKMVDHTTDPERITEQLGPQVDLVIDAGTGGITGSTVIDLTAPEPRILREGLGGLDILER